METELSVSAPEISGDEGGTAGPPAVCEAQTEVLPEQGIDSGSQGSVQHGFVTDVKLRDAGPP